MLYRKAYDRLLEWKGQPKRKALCIMGARQIGKTTVIRQFGKEQYSCSGICGIPCFRYSLKRNAQKYGNVSI